MIGFLPRTLRSLLIGLAVATTSGAASAQARPDSAIRDSLSRGRSLLDSVRVTAGRPRGLLDRRATGLDVRLDVFNALNALVWGGYANGTGGGGSRTQFGRPGDAVELFAAAPPRQFQLSLRYAFGGSASTLTP